LVLLNVIPYVAHSNTIVTAGGQDIVLSSDSSGEWSISIQNHGLISSTNIILHVKFKDDVEINYDTLHCNPSCDIKKAEGGNELEYQWNNLDVGNDIISVRFNVQFPHGPTGRLTPQFVEVRAEGEGIIFSYPY